MERRKVEIQSSDPSALASDRFNFILVSEMCLPGPGMATIPEQSILSLAVHSVGRTHAPSAAAQWDTLLSVPGFRGRTTYTSITPSARSGKSLYLLRPGLEIKTTKSRSSMHC